MRKIIENILFVLGGVIIVALFLVPLALFRFSKASENKMINCVEEQSGWIVIEYVEEENNLYLIVHKSENTDNLFYSVRKCLEDYNADYDNVSILWVTLFPFKDVRGNDIVLAYVSHAFTFPKNIYQEIPLNGTADYITSKIQERLVYHLSFSIMEMPYFANNPYHLSRVLNAR